MDQQKSASVPGTRNMAGPMRRPTRRAPGLVAGLTGGDGVSRTVLKAAPLRMWTVTLSNDSGRNQKINVGARTIEVAIRMAKDEFPGSWVVSAAHQGKIDKVEDEDV